MWVKSKVSQLPLSGVHDGDDTFEGRRDAFNKPLKEDILQYLGHKNLSPQTMKKVKWVTKMYKDWRNFRQSRETLENIECDLDDVHTIT